jgi:CheY-like chemotaxis protein
MDTCKILIIDDDTDDVEILADAFTRSGVDAVHYVHTAMQAFMYLECVEDPGKLPKLIVTDHYLPGITGPEFLKDLKGMERYRHIPVVVLSTIKTEDQIEKYRQMGAEDYLRKPVTYEEYLEVARYIAGKIPEKGHETEAGISS